MSVAYPFAVLAGLPKNIYFDGRDFSVVNFRHGAEISGLKEKVDHLSRGIDMSSLNERTVVTYFHVEYSGEETPSCQLAIAYDGVELVIDTVDDPSDIEQTIRATYPEWNKSKVNVVVDPVNKKRSSFEFMIDWIGSDSVSP